MLDVSFLCSLELQPELSSPLLALPYDFPRLEPVVKDTKIHSHHRNQFKEQRDSCHLGEISLNE